jgi:RHS repeat-associated protein
LIGDVLDELDRSSECYADGLCAFKPDSDSFLYDGPACDDVGLFDDRARHFDAWIGAWLCDEPLGCEALNISRNVSNQPADAVDATQIPSTSD